MSTDNIPASNRTPSQWIVGENLQEAIDKYISEDPARHKAAQEFGEFLLNHPQFSQVDTFKVEQKDLAGDEIMYRELCKMIKYYGVKPKELDARELAILQEKLGPTWKEELTKEYGFGPEDFE